MQRFWHFFKLPIIVTAIALPVVTVVGIVLLSSIMGKPNSDARAAMLGQGLGLLTAILLAPFWFYGMWEAGREHREKLQKARAKSKSKPSTPRKKTRS